MLELEREWERKQEREQEQEPGVPGSRVSPETRYTKDPGACASRIVTTYGQQRPKKEDRASDARPHAKVHHARLKIEFDLCRFAIQSSG